MENLKDIEKTINIILNIENKNIINKDEYKFFIIYYKIIFNKMLDETLLLINNIENEIGEFSNISKLEFINITNDEYKTEIGNENSDDDSCDDSGDNLDENSLLKQYYKNIIKEELKKNEESIINKDEFYEILKDSKLCDKF